MRARAALRRVGALFRAETRLALRDPSSLAIAFVLPAVLLFLFGYGVSLDARRLPVRWFDPVGTPTTRRLASTLAASSAFRLESARSARDAALALVERRARGALQLLDDAPSKALSGGPAALQLLQDGTDANTSRLLEGYVRGALDVSLVQESRARQDPLPPAVRLLPRVWYNQTANSRHFLVPGLVAILMTLIGALLTAMVAARDWDRGTIEALLASPLRKTEYVVGKLAPYFVLGMGGMAVTVVVAVGLFGVPLRGSVATLALSSALYLLAMLGQGLLISTLARSQFVAGQIAIVTAFLPAFMLSGFLFDLHSMPPLIRALAHLVPARWFVPVARSVFLVGDSRSVLLENLPPIALFAFSFLFLSVRKTPTRLDRP